MLFPFLLIILGIILGYFISSWNLEQWCRIEECEDNTKWVCTDVNRMGRAPWIAITILVLFGIWKVKEIIY